MRIPKRAERGMAWVGRGLLVLVSMAGPLLSSGCVPIIAVGAAGAAAGIYYTSTDTAYKTYAHPYRQVRGAFLEACKRMDIHLGDEIKEIALDYKDETFRGKTPQFTIKVTLQKVTETSTKVEVDVRRSRVVKDMETAANLLIQIDKALQK